MQVHVCKGFEFVWSGHTCGGQRLTLDAIPQELSTSLALNTATRGSCLSKKPQDPPVSTSTVVRL